MNELSQICHAARDSERLHEPLWLATVMRVKGSAYRHAGSRMLFSSGKVLAGSVSGGCLEARNNPEGGATFYFTIPIVKPAQ